MSQRLERVARRADGATTTVAVFSMPRQARPARNPCVSIQDSRRVEQGAKMTLVAPPFLDRGRVERLSNLPVAGRADQALVAHIVGQPVVFVEFQESQHA